MHARAGSFPFFPCLHCFCFLSFLSCLASSYLRGFVCLCSLCVHYGAFLGSSSGSLFLRCFRPFLAARHCSIRLDKQPARLLEVAGEGTYCCFFLSRIYASFLIYNVVYSSFRSLFGHAGSSSDPSLPRSAAGSSCVVPRFHGLGACSFGLLVYRFFF